MKATVIEIILLTFTATIKY